MENGRLCLDQQPFKFLGVNTRELIHYGNHAVTRFCNEKQMGQQLDAACQMGARVARIFLAHRAYNPDSMIRDVGDRLAVALEIAAGPADRVRADAIRLLVAVADHNKGRGYYPSNDDPFYSPDGANPNLDFATLHLAGPAEAFPHLDPAPGFGNDPLEGRLRAYILHERSRTWIGTAPSLPRRVSRRECTNCMWQATGCNRSLNATVSE